MSATAKIPVRCQPGAINENVNSHTGEQAGLIFGPERGFNVARALVGTESTCATFTEVEIKLMPGLYMRTLVIVEYERLPDCGEDVAAAWDEALAADRPVLFEAITDPEVPPLPPHIRFQQAHKLAKALPGDPHSGRIIRESVEGKVEEFLHR